jgi:hypothetical protein
MKWGKKKNRGAVAEFMDEMAAQVNRGIRRPMNMYLATIEQIRRMGFTPEDDANIAKKLRDGLLERPFLQGVCSDAQVEELERQLEEMRKSFAAKASR